MLDTPAASHVPLVVWSILVIAVAAFLAAAVRRRRRGRRWSGWRTASFVAGCGVVALAVSPPLTAWAHHDPRGHMLQHLLLGMLAPLGLVLSAPVTLLLASLPVTTARRVSALLRAGPVRALTHPFTALTLDTGGLYVIYLTPLFAVALASPLLHGLVQAHFLAAGCLFVWAVASPDPAPHRAPFRTRLVALFLAAAGHGTLAKLMYAYGWPRGTGLDVGRTREAARLMYYGGDAAELLLAVALFAAWYRVGARPYRRPVQTEASSSGAT